MQASAFELYNTHCTCRELLHTWASSSAVVLGSAMTPHSAPQLPPAEGDNLVLAAHRRRRTSLSQVLRIASLAAPNSDLHLLLACKVFGWCLKPEGEALCLKP